MTAAEAKAEIRRVSGSQLDPRCVEALLSVFNRQEIQVTTEVQPAPEAATTG